MDILFFELAIVIITASLVALLVQWLKQPLIIAYMITGLLVGPSLFDLLHSPEAFTSFSEIGVAFLLFLVGLNLNWKHIKEVGKIALLAGIGQILFTTMFGYVIAVLLGFDLVTSLFLGLAFALSSTIVIVKLLSDKDDIDRFYGRVSVGILIIQDIVAMVILLFINATSTGDSFGSILSVALINGILALAFLMAAAEFVLPHVFRYAAHSKELLFLTAIAWCFAIASALHLIGFGIEIGALFAGMTLAGTGYQREIEKQIVPLRDFFLIIFFIILGTQLTLADISASWFQALIFSAFVLIGNPLIVIFILRAFGYHPRTGFLVGVTLAQISEFSFIILAEAAVVGLISHSIVPMVTIAGIITIGVSSYLISYNEVLYEKFSFLFHWLEQETDSVRQRRNKITPVIVCGYHRLGKPVLQTLEKEKEDYVVIDFNPSVIEELKEHHIPHIYGDAGDEDVLKYVRADKAKLIISTLLDDSVNKDILRFLKDRKSSVTSVMSAKTSESARKLYEAGATFVIIPHILGGELFAQLLKKSKTRKSSWNALRKKQKI